MLKSLSELGLRKWSLSVVGIILLIVYYILDQASVNTGSPNQESDAVQNLLFTSFNDFKGKLLFISIALIGLNTIYIAFVDKVIDIWRRIVLPDIKKNIDSASETYVNIVKTETIDRVFELAEKKDIEKNIKPIFEKLYGQHCIKDKGLFQQLSRQIFPFLEPERVHRSNYTKKITIEVRDNKQIWHEHCEFSLHCIALDADYVKVNNGSKFTYTLNYNPRMMVKDIPAKLEEMWNLKIGIVKEDGSKEVIFNSINAVEINDGKPITKESTEYAIDVEIENNEFSCRFSKEIELTKAYTKIFITETSSLPENFYTLTTKEPSCGMDIDIHLPSDWEFLDSTIYNADKSWSISSHPSNRLSCHTNGWVLPGIVFSCIWDQKSLYKKAEI